MRVLRDPGPAGDAAGTSPIEAYFDATEERHLVSTAQAQGLTSQDEPQALDVRGQLNRAPDDGAAWGIRPEMRVIVADAYLAATPGG